MKACQSNNRTQARPRSTAPVCCPAGPGQGGLGVPSQGNLLDWADKALGQGISSVTRSVKNLLSGARQAPVAAALEALMDGKQVRLLAT